jgi:dTDP-4-dehydrorhamnose reductase
MMRVLVTGAGGQLANALVATAPPDVEATALPIDALDIADPASVTRAFERIHPAVVVNAAAYTAVDLAEKEPDEADRVNHRAVAILAAACRAHRARLVHVSTDYVFDGASGQPYRPLDATNPLSVYGRTKRDGELAALAAPDALVVRTAWLYGAMGRNFVHTMIRLMRERDEVRVVADQFGTPTAVEGLARAIWALAAQGASGIHHWTDAGVASWYDFAVAIRDDGAAAGLGTGRARVVPIPTSEYPTPARRPARSVLSKDETYAALGTAGTPWRDALRRVLAEIAAMNHASTPDASTRGAAC